jgi:hypothetical protein
MTGPEPFVCVLRADVLCDVFLALVGKFSPFALAPTLMVAGSIFAFFFVIKPSRVVKSDGTVVQFERTSAADGLGELKQVAKLFGNKYMLLLTPLIIQVST